MAEDEELIPVTPQQIYDYFEPQVICYQSKSGVVMIPWTTSVVTVSIEADKQVLVARSLWSVKIPIHARSRLLEYCHKWNRTKYWPIAQLRTRDDGDSSLSAELVLPIIGGITQSQLKVFLDNAMSHFAQWISILEKSFPDVRFGADPLLEGNQP